MIELLIYILLGLFVLFASFVAVTEKRRNIGLANELVKAKSREVFLEGLLKETYGYVPKSMKELPKRPISKPDMMAENCKTPLSEHSSQPHLHTLSTPDENKLAAPTQP